MSMLDFIVVIVVLLTFSISTMVGLFVLTEFETATEGTMDNEVRNSTIATTKWVLQSFDYLFIFILFGLGLGVVIGAFFVRTHPIFFVMSIFTLAIILTISGQFSNVFYEIASFAPLNTVSGDFPIMLAVWDNMPVILLALGVMLVIVLYSKFKGGDNF